MPDEITINLFHVWLVCKALIAYPLLRWESKLLPGRSIHKLARRLLFHFAINPELGVIKLIAFVPVWFFTGSKLLGLFLPVQGREPDYKCRTCRDSGYTWQLTGSDMRKKVTCPCRLGQLWRGVAESYK